MELEYMYKETFIRMLFRTINFTTMSKYAKQ